MAEIKRRTFMKSGSLLTAGLLTGSACSVDNQAPDDESPDTILTAIMNRRSVRKYRSTPVPEDHIRLILEAGRMAPTSGNQQPWKFIVTRDQSIIDSLKETCISNSVNRIRSLDELSEDEVAEQIQQVEEYYENCFTAPVFVTVLTDNESTYPTYNHWDGPLAAANIMIAARALGYGTVHYTDTIPPAVTKDVLQISDRYERVCITPIGIPDEWPEAPEKKAYESFIVHNTF